MHRAYRLSHKKQQGVVIVVALFIVALVATMAYIMMSRLARDTRQTTLILRNVQAENYAQGSIAWARDHLKNDFERQKPKQMIDPVPIQSPIKEVDGYKISSKIDDLQARFNLNNLTDAEAQRDFVRLIRAVSPAINQEQAQQLTRAIADWITPITADNEFSKYYLSLSKPYRTAHRAMQSITELRLVKGMTPALYQALEPFVAALPPPTLINLQTASAEVLMTLSPDMTLDTAKAIQQLQKTALITSTEAFYNLDIVKNNHLPSNKLTAISNYFLVQTEVTIENQRLLIYTLLERKTNGNQATVSILSQSKGTW
ncbi:MAG: type II secretory pathway protein LspK [uncultured bacterium]|nr:MAG: type II secretory pathway protein LspK [uncultured bacterium]